jgi:hypothetical protein
MIGVRFREDIGFEGKCDYCSQWWPLDVEFWRPKAGLRRCHACWRIYHRMHEAGRRTDEAIHEMVKTGARLNYYANREKRLVANRAWKAANPERVREYQRLWREKNRERVNASSRAYYTEARDVILKKKRAAYRGEEAA